MNLLAALPTFTERTTKNIKGRCIRGKSKNSFEHLRSVIEVRNLCISEETAIVPRYWKNIGKKFVIEWKKEGIKGPHLWKTGRVMEVNSFKGEYLMFLMIWRQENEIPVINFNYLK